MQLCVEYRRGMGKSAHAFQRLTLGFQAIAVCFFVTVAGGGNLLAEDLLGQQRGVRSNSLEMKFSPISKTVWMCVHETRKRDFSAFVADGGKQLPEPTFEQAGDHPVVNVSWEDAQRFAMWLTVRERSQGLISTSESYRLPSEEEWMLAAGVEQSNGDEFGQNRQLVFTWGESWPPPLNAGNFGDALGGDDFRYTAPVASFPPNKNGFHDMAGNVWEWCDDTFEGATDIRVLKGGSWRMREPSRLALNRKIGNTCGLRLPTYGFRLVLAAGK